MNENIKCYGYIIEQRFIYKMEQTCGVVFADNQDEVKSLIPSCPVEDENCSICIFEIPITKGNYELLEV